MVPHKIVVQFDINQHPTQFFLGVPVEGGAVFEEFPQFGETMSKVFQAIHKCRDLPIAMVQVTKRVDLWQKDLTQLLYAGDSDILQSKDTCPFVQLAIDATQLVCVALKKSWIGLLKLLPCLPQICDLNQTGEKRKAVNERQGRTGDTQ